MDTKAAALEAQLAVLRRLGAEGRLRIAAELSEDVRRLSIEGRLRRNPWLSEAEAMREVFGLLLGTSLASRVWPTTPSP